MNQRTAIMVATGSARLSTLALAVLSSPQQIWDETAVSTSDKTAADIPDGIGMKKSLADKSGLSAMSGDEAYIVADGKVAAVQAMDKIAEIKVLGNEAAGIKVAPLVDLMGKFGTGARRASPVGHSREVKNAAAWPGHALRRDQAGQIARA